MSKTRILEQEFLSRLLSNPSEFGEIRNYGISRKHFKNAAYADIFDYILENVEKTGSVPHPSTVHKVSSFTPVPAVEPLSFYCDGLLSAKVFDELRDGFNSVFSRLDANDVEAALEAAKVAVKQADAERRRRIEAFWTHEVDPRIERYSEAEALSASGRVDGWPMPWDEFTDITRGWRKKDLGIIAARTGVGKTMNLILHAHSAWCAGARVLIVSMEMSPISLQLRHDAYIANVPLDKLIRGTLSSVQKDRYLTTLDALRSIGGVAIIGHDMSAKSSDIYEAIDRFEPDIVFIDGMYMVSSDFAYRGMSQAERYGLAAIDMKNYAKHFDIPIVGTWQINRDHKRSSKEVTIETLYGSDALNHTAAIIIGMAQTPDDRRDGILNQAIIKNREGRQIAGTFEWDYDEMSFDLTDYELDTTIVTTGVKATSTISF